MVSHVQYRSFMDEDFEDIAEMLRRVWHDRSRDELYNTLEARYDLAHSLSISTFSLVAVVNGEAMGIVLARDPHGSQARYSAIDAGAWERLGNDLRHDMARIDPVAIREFDAAIKAEQRANEKLATACSVEQAGQITLLAVSHRARGLGIGSALLDAACSFCQDAGAEQAYLFTDTDCSWQFYERHGLKRAAAHQPEQSERALLPSEMYLYTADLAR